MSGQDDITKNLTREEKIKLLELYQEKERRVRENLADQYFPDEGPLRRELYPKHTAFFEAGAKHKERAFIAGNRIGKSVAGGYEVYLHATGLYPDWWKGKRFTSPTSIWCAGKTNETTRNIIQNLLIGPKMDVGTGLIPKKLIERVTAKSGVTDAIQDVYVKHVSGGHSHIEFKSYVQGVESFMGTSKHVIWLDEEPSDVNIYSECLTRTMTTKGIMMCTFTPLLGLSDIVLSFLPGGRIPEDGVVSDE